MNIFGKQKILIPKKVDMSKWAVVACDQFTSQPEYWEKLDKYVGNNPSTLRITLPEIYLNDMNERVKKINQTMSEYTKNDLFIETDGFVLIEREVEEGKKRKGLVLSVDLEAYDWRRIKCPIRATEDTIVERLPARVEIRKGAEIELPHILLLIDDKEKQIIEPLYQNREKYKKLYDFDLNMNGGHIRGYEISKTDEITEKFKKLTDHKLQTEKYGCDAKILFAVGDGNHSLASAKAWWEELKKELSEEQRKNHPARFALVEVVNIYDDALIFEPIHRVLKNCDISFIDKLKESIKGNGVLKVFTKEKTYNLSAPEKSSDVIKQTQEFIERYIKTNKAEVDYIHGEKHLEEVVNNNRNSIGIIMPYFKKDELFNYVINVGNLPKKAFSIGGPEFKKYYLEAKRIK